MSAFLKAEVAMNEGDREEALKDYAEAVEYDPGTTQVVSLHDGSQIRLKKLRADYDAVAAGWATSTAASISGAYVSSLTASNTGLRTLQVTQVAVDPDRPGVVRVRELDRLLACDARRPR